MESKGSLQEMLHGVPQGSILGPLLFNVFLCDLFYFLEGTDTTSYVDDTTPLNINLLRNYISMSLRKHVILFKW